MSNEPVAQTGPAAPAAPSGPAVAPTQSSHAPAPRPRGTRNFAPRAKLLAASSTHGLPDLLRVATEDAIQHDIPNDAPSTYVPSSIHFYRCINDMDIFMSQTRRFWESNAWTPLLSQLHFGILLILYTMHVSAQNGQLGMMEQLLLTWFFARWKPTEILIPGPLIPFFASLTVSSAPYEGYGNVSPTMPRRCSARNTTLFYLQHGHALLVPPIPQIMSMLRHALVSMRPNDSAPVTDDNDAVQHDFYRHILGIDVSTADATSWVRYAAVVPNNANVHNANPSVLRSFANIGNAYLNSTGSILPNFDANAGGPARELQWIQYLGFATPDNARLESHAWYNQCFATMNRYCQFFKDSTTLDKIATSGLGANLVIYAIPTTSQYYDMDNYTAPAAAQAAPAAVAAINMSIRRKINTVLMTHGLHADPDLPDLAVQYSQVTNMNIDHVLAPAPFRAIFATPDRATSMFGPVWNLIPIRQVVPRDSPAGYAATIGTFYHVDTRIN
jgi:hypothetical protein